MVLKLHITAPLPTRRPLLSKENDGPEEVGECFEIFPNIGPLCNAGTLLKVAMFLAQERLVATLAYTNPDEVDERGKLLVTTSPSEEALQQKLANNPVYRAFEDVHDVDDLYRIADLWLNPATSDST